MCEEGLVGGRELREGRRWVGMSDQRRNCGCSMCTIKRGRCHIFGEAKLDTRGWWPAFLYMLMVFILVSSSTVSNCICVFIYLVPATAEKYTTLSDEQLKVHPVLSMPENELTRALNAKISFSHVNTHFSHSTALLQQEKTYLVWKGKMILPDRFKTIHSPWLPWLSCQVESRRHPFCFTSNCEKQATCISILLCCLSEGSRWFLTACPSLSLCSPVALSLTGGAEGGNSQEGSRGFHW